MGELAELGLDEEKLTKIALESLKNLKWIQDNLDKLREEYGNKYIAVLNEEIIDLDDRLDILRERLKYKEETDAVVVEYITPNKVVYMF